MSKEHTAHIETVLQSITDTLRSTLDDNLVALYTYGSVFTPDFDPESSDIDCIAVTLRPLSDADLERLRIDLKEAVQAKKWAQRLQISFLASGRLLVSDTTACLYQFGTLSRSGSDGNPIIWIDHFQRGRVLFGPKPESLVPSISKQILWEALVRELGYLRDELVDKPDSNWRDQASYRAYAVVTMCRILFTAATGNLGTKPEAAEWARLGLLSQFTDEILLAARRGRQRDDDKLSLSRLREMIGVVTDQMSRFGANPSLTKNVD